MRKVVLAGGTGFIGEYLANKFKDSGYEVIVISRKNPYFSWDNKLGLIKAVEGAELLINLAGKSVNCRYNEANKKEIMNSRVKTTTLLGEAVQACENPPSLWINSSTATIYRHAEDRPMTEAEGEIGTGFSVDVGTKWEETFFSYELPGTRQAALRIAIVLGKDGGVITPYKNLVKLGLGGNQGTGNQMFSWIHVEDLYQIILFLQKKQELRGVFNCASPEPVSNRELMRTLRKTMRVPFGLPAPKWMLEAGSVMIRTETELVLKSRWVVPERLEREGYTFRFKSLEKTLQDIL
ncbi:TIGR01777 family oxidoreductase [Terribacillus sp. DMT04]|uniref:TIGR01777 family oxidoreductase n=1 Tax=Terribacillus sp. DMT04 TaxID=2850441 RepID=UPI001C2BD511|nr:TIGR01777 family oxidoreductase [Terribacillus sp. DMT04]QXE02904.1 TIGR01777 family oxidoreductase [Terribacillus sp. DMT04]